MLQLYPANAGESLEFSKIKQLLLEKCRCDSAKERVHSLRFNSRLDFIEKALLQTSEFRSLMSGNDYFPNDFTRNIEKELQLLAISGATLAGSQLLLMKDLAQCIRNILTWLQNHNNLYPQIQALADKITYEKEIVKIVDAVIDEQGNVRDNASKELMQIRMELSKQRQNLRKVFETIIRKLGKQGYLADISESFLNGRRTVAITAEHKRIVKGILHGESDTSKTVFIEPEETIELNNEIFSLERSESREVHRILAQTTASLSGYQPHLLSYYHLVGLYDFIRAKAQLAVEMNAFMPRLSAHPGINLIKAYHPLLYLNNKRNNKTIIPTNIQLERQERILIISGPNAGGKTVTMKTVGLLQLMLQAGLLVPADPNSEMGIFKQIMIHIGDTQSIEHELSTYSAHLRDMKYFMDFANGKTLFFIDELGSGSDPNLGGAFAEAIVEELAHKHALGIVTTHYLNLKVMAGKVNGIVNGAMAFDEEKLEPLYQLSIGKPGSSYTFAIAQRSGLDDKIINRARALTERGHFKLDKMLLQTEQQVLQLGNKEKDLNKLLKENEKLKKEYEHLNDKERVHQQQEVLKLQNKIKKEELDYLREMERNFKQIIIDWKKSENKNDVIKNAESVLFKKKQIQSNQSAARKADKSFELVGGVPKIGDLLRHKTNHQIGTLADLRDKTATVMIGKMPFKVSIEDWLVVRKKDEAKKKK
ncbi:MAG: DNA mismatch repair protein MutS [Chitinophagaceae bacterium]|jgi:DNA mismatch repair protein MutS2